VDRDEMLNRVRELRAKSTPPKVIARALGLKPAEVGPLIRAVAEEIEASAPESGVSDCWISPGWATGLTISGRGEWPGVRDTAEDGAAGLVSVVVAREARGGRASVCGYLVDVYCLGVKNALGPKVMDSRAVSDFLRTFYRAYDEPLAAPLDLVQHLVFGAVEYARGLGFEPHRDFAGAAGHLGSWTGPSAITFGHRGQPLFMQGPNDNAAHVMRTLQRTVGEGNFQFVMGGMLG